MTKITIQVGNVTYTTSEDGPEPSFYESRERFVKDGSVRLIRGRLYYCFSVHRTWLVGTILRAPCFWAKTILPPAVKK